MNFIKNNKVVIKKNMEKSFLVLVDLNNLLINDNKSKDVSKVVTEEYMASEIQKIKESENIVNIKYNEFFTRKNKLFMDKKTILTYIVAAFKNKYDYVDYANELISSYKSFVEKQERMILFLLENYSNKINKENDLGKAIEMVEFIQHQHNILRHGNRKSNCIKSVNEIIKKYIKCIEEKITKNVSLDNEKIILQHKNKIVDLYRKEIASIRENSSYNSVDIAMEIARCFENSGQKSAEKEQLLNELVNVNGFDKITTTRFEFVKGYEQKEFLFIKNYSPQFLYHKGENLSNLSYVHSLVGWAVKKADKEVNSLAKNVVIKNYGRMEYIGIYVNPENEEKIKSMFSIMIKYYDLILDENIKNKNALELSSNPLLIKMFDYLKIDINEKRMNVVLSDFTEAIVLKDMREFLLMYDLELSKEITEDKIKKSKKKI